MKALFELVPPTGSVTVGEKIVPSIPRIMTVACAVLVVASVWIVRSPGLASSANGARVVDVWLPQVLSTTRPAAKPFSVCVVLGIVLVGVVVVVVVATLALPSAGLLAPFELLTTWVKVL